MKIEIILNKNVKFTASAKLFRRGAIQKTSELRCNRFRVSMSINDSKKVSFQFSGSHNDWQAGKTSLNAEDLTFPIYCFISDSISAKESFENFCGEFGYDTDSRTAERIYKECKKSLSKLESIYDGDLYDLINEYQEKYNC